MSVYLGSWSDCTGPCGGGIGSKTRTIDIKNMRGPEQKPCPVLVKDMQTESCKTDPCPIPMCKWTDWSDCTGPVVELEKNKNEIRRILLVVKVVEM